MKPLVLEFAETPDGEDQDWSLIQYSEELNLSVIAGTKIPAVRCLDASTVTGTRSIKESSDSDKDIRNIGPLLATSTYSANPKETTDTDQTPRGLQNLLATQTVTKNVEATDSDK